MLGQPKGRPGELLSTPHLGEWKRRSVLDLAEKRVKRGIPIFNSRFNGALQQAWAENPRSTRWFRLVVAVSVAVRLAALIAARHAAMASDAQNYVAMASKLVSGERFVPYWPPGVALYLAPLVAVGASPLVLRATSLIFWLVACWGLYRLMKAMGMAGVAWVVLLVFSLLPDAIQMAMEPMTQMPVAALLLVGLSCVAIVLQRASTAEFLLLGVALGAMSLIRPSALPLLVLLPLACGWVTKRVVPALAGVLLGLALLGGWMLYARALSGRLMVNTANAVNMFYGNNSETPAYQTWYFGSHAKVGSDEIDAFPEFAQTLERVEKLPELDRSAEYERVTIAYVRANPGMFVYRTANRVRAFLGFDVFTSAALKGVKVLGLPVFLPALAGEALIYLLIAGTAAFWMARAPAGFWRDKVNVALLVTMVIYAVPYWISMSHPTYHFPLLLPLAVVGVSAWRMSDGAAADKWRGWWCVGLLLLVQAEWVWRAAGTASLGAVKIAP